MVSQEYYDDWLCDYIIDLRKDFIEEKYSEEFEKYCKQKFADYLDENQLAREKP